jgi:hypothetical protein
LIVDTFDATYGRSISSLTPTSQGEGEDFTFRTRAELGLIRCGGSHPIQAVVLTLNNREWIGAVTMFPDGTRWRDFVFRKNPNGSAHALLLASDLIQNACCFAPHLELGIDGMA